VHDWKKVIAKPCQIGNSKGFRISKSIIPLKNEEYVIKIIPKKNYYEDIEQKLQDEN